VSFKRGILRTVKGGRRKVNFITCDLKGADKTRGGAPNGEEKTTLTRGKGSGWRRWGQGGDDGKKKRKIKTQGKKHEPTAASKTTSAGREVGGGENRQEVARPGDEPKGGDFWLAIQTFKD